MSHPEAAREVGDGARLGLERGGSLEECRVVDAADRLSVSQIFTIFYILTGIGVFVALLASVAQPCIEQKAEYA